MIWSRLRIVFQIILPLSVPGLISALIFCFTLSWNEYLYALVFMSSPAHKTVPGSKTETSDMCCAAASIAAFGRAS